MSLKYGLNIKSRAPVPVRKPIFGKDEEEEDEPTKGVDNRATVEEISSFGNKSAIPIKSSIPGRPSKTSRPPARQKGDDDRQDLSAIGASKARLKAAEEVDPSIFDYDSFHDAKATVTEAKKEAARQDAIERKPKYINNLLDAASRRKQDQLIAREKLLQKEREAEGDEFADKEKFVTGAYKQQQEEARKLEEEEKRKAEEEEQRKRRLGGGGMQTFYRNMMDQSERQHAETVAAAAELEKDGGVKPKETAAQRKTDADIAAEMKAKGVKIHLNEEGQVTDKRELLSAGLNVAPAGRAGDKSGADHLKTANRPTQSAFQSRSGGNQQAQRERQSRMLEEQLAAQTKRAREEEEEEKARLEKAAKTSKTEKDVSDAKARYLARKAAKERGEG